MTKPKSTTPTPDTHPLEDARSTGIRHEATTGLAGPRIPDLQTEMRNRSDNGHEAAAPTNAEVINALSNAPPYLLSRAETMFGAYNHFHGGSSVPFHNLSVTERAAWLAVARSVGS